MALVLRYGWGAIDWNGDGRTSAREFLRAADVGSRMVEEGSVPGVEYLSLRDGLPITTVCRANPNAAR